MQLAELVLPLLLSSTIIGLSISNNGSSRWLNPITRLSMQTGLIWPDFCSALIVERLAPLGLHNTRFRSVPVSCSPRTGADASSPPPRDPPERRQFQVPQIPEGLASPDELGLVRAVGALGHGVVVRVADRAGRGKHAVFPDLVVYTVLMCVFVKLK